MRTIDQALTKLGACKRAVKKYEGRRDFKRAFISCHWSDGEWLGFNLFDGARASSFKKLPSCHSWIYDGLVVDSGAVSLLFRSKANRLKYWPEVRKRLMSLGARSNPNWKL